MFASADCSYPLGTLVILLYNYDRAYGNRRVPHAILGPALPMVPDKHNRPNTRKHCCNRIIRVALRRNGTLQATFFEHHGLSKDHGITEHGSKCKQKVTKIQLRCASHNVTHWVPWSSCDGKVYEKRPVPAAQSVPSETWRPGFAQVHLDRHGALAPTGPRLSA